MNKAQLFIEFEKLTDELLKLDINDTTGDLISEIENKLSEREKLMSEIDNCSNSGQIDENLIYRLLQKNQQLETKFQEVKINIKNSIENIVNEKSLSSKKKKAHRGYMNAGHQTDGYFIDRKK